MNNPEESPARPARPRAPDTRCVELDSRGEIEFWLKVFNTSESQLLAAIAEVGPVAEAVATHLRSVASRG